MPELLVRLAVPDAAGHDRVTVALAPNGDPTQARELGVPSLAALLSGTAADFRQALSADASGSAVSGRLLPPVDGLTEVWASGVTYRRSSEARQEESQVADVYARVYDAERPELFFKAPAWRVCGHGEPVGVRADSSVNVPEPELALVCTASGELVGLTICNDVSSRSIEGENPLYLPQAKTYTGSCALGPGIVPIGAVKDARSLAISMQVERGGAVAWSGATSTAAMHRTFDDLIGHLYRGLTFPHGAVLSTGTGLVPDLDWTMAPGDIVRVTVEGVGTLENPVRAVEDDAFYWLTPDPARSPA